MNRGSILVMGSGGELRAETHFLTRLKAGIVAEEKRCTLREAGRDQQCTYIVQ